MPKKATFRHEGTLLTDLTFNASAVNQMGFMTLDCPRPLPNTTTDNGTLLNGRKYSHILSKTKENEIIITSNELDETAITFFETWWISPVKYLSLNEGAYQEVFVDGGEFPLSYVDDLEFFPEITLKLSWKV